jgi:hypothetical protein
MEHQALLDQGFPQDRAEKAIAATQASGIVNAVEWCVGLKFGEGVVVHFSFLATG